MQRFHSASFLLYVFQCLQTFLLFSDRLNWKNNNTSNHEFSLHMSAWPWPMRFIVGKFYILGQGSTYSFIYSLFFIILLKYVAANAFGIWNLRNTGKSVTNWATHMLHQIDWDSATCITYSTDYYQRLTLESWFTNLEQTPLNRSQQLPALYRGLIDEIKQN